MIDTHCHLNHDRFEADLEATLERSHRSGVVGHIVVGFDRPSSSDAVRLAVQYSNLWAAVGIHPHDATGYSAADTGWLRDLAQAERVVAIGEIGLDYHRDYSPRVAQRDAFAAQLALAVDLGLPVVIHCRDAYDDVLDTLAAYRGAVRGVMHCWSGTVEDAERALDLGMMLGIGGVLTFVKPGSLPDSVRIAGLDRIVLETDAPYLAPAPYRGKRNEPAYLTLIRDAVARVLSVDEATVARQTTLNSYRLFDRMIPVAA